ncbi:hypothetical protein QR680_011034 [Steinernema hermaphroditum]|uniref:Uncharacterized protein n=1 Tax=Steinernema hermaphroditum TaxID=289476 RepID=A0AA39IQX3_9BILA|nr:hypothetical protein QR680_011034 [Steinernema hermaphroditum]
MICRAIRFICCGLTCLLILVVVVMLVIIIGEEVFMWLKVESRSKDFEAVFAKARLDLELNPVVGPYGHWVYGIIPGNHTEWYKNDRVFLAEYKYDADENERRLREGMVKKAINNALRDKPRLTEDDLTIVGAGMGNNPFQRCEETNAVTCLPAFKEVDFEKMHEYMVAENERIIACVAPGSFKRHLETLMCYLSDPTEFKRQNKRVRIERERKFGSGLCRSKPRYSSLSSIYSKTQSSAPEWHHIMMHENPGERFVNAYIQACLENDYDVKTSVGHMCWECEEDLTCFIERIFARMLLIDGGKAIPDESDYPFLPQTWFCRLHEDFGWYSVLQAPLDNNEKTNMTIQISEFLQEKGVAEENAETAADAFYWKLRKYKTKSEEVPVEIDAQKFYSYQLSISSYMKRFLVKMYYYDYAYFKLSVPWFS